MAKSERAFPISAVLSVVGEKLLCPIQGVYDVMNFMTGESLFTTQLITYRGPVSAAIRKQHPQFDSYNDDSVTNQNYREWLARQVKKYGEFVTLKTIAGKIPVADPITDLMAMGMKPEQITVVTTGKAKGHPHGKV